jgi:hypothetical protein
VPLVVLTGASGAGKTTIAIAFAHRFPSIAVHRFDSIGVPPAQTMAARHGSIEGWQRATTHEWLARLRRPSEDGNVLLEGQMRIAFVEEAAAAAAWRRRRSCWSTAATRSGCSA